MLCRKEAVSMAIKELEDSGKFLHSIRVGKLMESLAIGCKEDQELWHVVGICHDLDYEKTKDNFSRHGILTSEHLHNRLPEEALNAIASHDHRTGIKSDTLLAIGLRTADSTDAIYSRISFENLHRLLSQPDIFLALYNELGDRSYLLDNVREFLNKTGMEIKELISLIFKTT